MTNKRREMGNRAILSSSLLPFHNGKIVTLQCACFATEDLPPLESKTIFFWDSARVNWRMLVSLCSIFLCVSPTCLLYLFFCFFLLLPSPPCSCVHPFHVSSLTSEHFLLQFLIYQGLSLSSDGSFFPSLVGSSFHSRTERRCFITQTPGAPFMG